MKTCDVQSRSRCCVVMRESGKWFSQSLVIWLVGHDFGSAKDPSVTRFPSLSNQNFSCIISVELQGSETIHTGGPELVHASLPQESLLWGLLYLVDSPGQCKPHSVALEDVAL